MQMSFVANDALNFCKFVPGETKKKEKKNNSVNINKSKRMSSSRIANTLTMHKANV